VPPLGSADAWLAAPTDLVRRIPRPAREASRKPAYHPSRTPRVVRGCFLFL